MSSGASLTELIPVQRSVSAPGRKGLNPELRRLPPTGDRVGDLGY